MRISAWSSCVCFSDLDCSRGQALSLQFPVELSDLYGRLSTHVAYISGESAGKFQFCLGECFGRSAPRFLHHLAKLVWIIIVGIQAVEFSARDKLDQPVSGRPNSPSWTQRGQ